MRHAAMSRQFPVRPLANTSNSESFGRLSEMTSRLCAGASLWTGLHPYALLHFRNRQSVGRGRGRKVDGSDVGSFFPFRTFAEINVATLQKVVEPADAVPAIPESLNEQMMVSILARGAVILAEQVH